MDNTPRRRRLPFWPISLRRTPFTPIIPPQSSSNPSPGPGQLAPSPTHQRPLDTNPQLASPLYNGRIPPEIRDQIFAYALTEYTRPDAASQYPASTAFTRPGYAGKRAVTVALLLTCRRVYQETHHLPPASKEHVFWHSNGPAGPERNPFGDSHERFYFARMTGWQRAQVRELHLFTQMFWLESSFGALCKQPFMKGLERVTITIRRGDWWWNERNAPLAISPRVRTVQHGGEMVAEWERERRGFVVPFGDDAWGSMFQQLPHLKELVMELETAEDKALELKTIVEKAKGWKFPMKGGMVLSAEGLGVETMVWRSPPCNFSDRCPYCGGPGLGGNCAGSTDKCDEKKSLIAEGKGPLCTVSTLRWRLVQGEARERQLQSLVTLP